jgi:uncharacterized protein (DUF2235 family)
MEAAMKRIVVLIDGTWDEEGIGDATNLAKLDPAYGDRSKALIKESGANGTIQKTFYHAGVGTEPDFIRKILGGAIGLGLKKIVQDCYGFIVDHYLPGDEIYIFGFSRGAYAARALAGLIGASGIRRQNDPQGFDVVWNHYRVKPASRDAPQAASAADRKALAAYNAMAAQKDRLHQDRTIKCVGVWETVGSYGVPAGLGLARLARYVALVCGLETISMSGCTRLGSMKNAGPSCRHSGPYRRENTLAAWWSRPGSRASIAMSAAAIRTAGSPMRRSCG